MKTEDAQEAIRGIDSWTEFQRVANALWPQLDVSQASTGGAWVFLRNKGHVQLPGCKTGSAWTRFVVEGPCKNSRPVIIVEDWCGEPRLIGGIWSLLSGGPSGRPEGVE